MDEFIEFDTRTLEALRQPLEDKTIRIARTKGAYTMPADFILITAMNPADTLAGDDTVIRQKAQRQAQKLSRPIIDRIDLWVEVPRIPYASLDSRSAGQSSALLQEMVRRTRTFMGTASQQNTICAPEARAVLRTATEQNMLSPRSIVRTLRVARTIASLVETKCVEAEHVLEALQYRPKRPFI